MPEWGLIIFRSVGALVMLFALTRLLGKKQISQLTFFEYITGITLGELAGFISTDIERNYMHGVIALLVWTLIPFGLGALTLKSMRVRNWLDGRKTALIQNGKILENNLKKERYTANELLEQLRTKNVFNVADVEFAILESSGDLSVLLKEENLPLTPKSLGIKVPAMQEPQAVVIDGKILNGPLVQLGRSRDWLLTELEKVGVALDNVFLCQVDGYGQLYVDMYDDKKKVPLPQVRPLLLSTLKKCAADLELFALSTRNEKAKQMYAANARLLEQSIDKLTPLLKRG
ncbi:hypothetical protein J31TS4_28190 [Paenibacillus sp. J31TS4]|uniref:DUF421 domain-containing protein n=1 Tax=Paenibacillus sp. J31TS4 TaxID=2807195 RepID=UPI001B1DE6BA|nr:DUF421 domain-containing protein [Paenibacillus sp. J31TS4]GIP39539.1 hypothetical protein J31TS4_28190 [Paenibacillus sp. J31TS4]